MKKIVSLLLTVVVVLSLVGCGKAEISDNETGDLPPMINMSGND